MCVCLIFIFTCGIFLVYDQMVERRQNIVMTQAKKTGAIVSSLFPDSVTKRLLADNNKASSQERKFLSPNARLQSFLQSHGNDHHIMQAKPIADMFPYTTVVFAGTIKKSCSHTSGNDSHLLACVTDNYRFGAIRCFSFCL